MLMLMLMMVVLALGLAHSAASLLHRRPRPRGQTPRELGSRTARGARRHKSGRTEAPTARAACWRAVQPLPHPAKIQRCPRSAHRHFPPPPPPLRGRLRYIRSTHSIQSVVGRSHLPHRGMSTSRSCRPDRGRQQTVPPRTLCTGLRNDKDNNNNNNNNNNHHEGSQFWRRLQSGVRLG
jgi:hypothetical protein